MRYLKIVFIFCILTGCVSTLPDAGISQSYQHVGATVLSPNEAGWYLLKLSDPSVVFVKKYPDKTETAIANTYLFWVGELDSDEAFFERIIESRNTIEHKSRFKQLTVDYQSLTFKNRPCVKYSGIAEDHGDKGLDSTEFQYFKNIGYICRTNLNRTTALLMEVSHRSDSKDIPSSLRNTAFEFFENIKQSDY
jgi:hypothetical protein